ncbi:MAG TPA: hypothetical protein VK446_07265 [Methylocystis sp.]|nr:hypothetical protein [Methylocystis sp.]
MSAKTSLLLVAVSALAATGAFAQVATPMTGALPPQAAGAVRVQVSLQATTPVAPNATPDEQKAIAEAARIKLYENARAECAVLSKAFDAECKLLTVSASVINPYGAMPATTASVTAIYELAPHGK